MKARIDYTNVPEALRGMYQLEHHLHNSGLVWMRKSGCSKQKLCAPPRPRNGGISLFQRFLKMGAP